jgi:hypothetical protein
MSFPYLNPISPLRVFGPESVSREKSYGTNFSTLSVGGYMEVFSLDQLRYTIPPLTYGQVNYSGNSIPITYSVGSGSTFSYNTLILNPDNISSGRKKIGMLVYVKDENQIYQFNINNYDTLWNAATGATGVGGSTVVVSSFGTTVKANTPEGIAFISGWTANTIDGVSGYTYETAVWKKYYGSNLSITGGTFNSGTGILSLKNITGGTVNISGYTPASGTSLIVGTTNIISGSSGGILFQNTSNILSQNSNLFWDNTNSRLGIGTRTPSYSIDVSGLTLANSSVSAQGSFNVNQLAAPTAITGFTLSAGSSLGVGTYYYRVVYVTSIGETNTSGNLTVITTTGNTTVNLSGIPISTDPRVTARKLYRTKLGGSTDNQWFLATISNNTTTTYTDSIADASLTGANLQAYKVNTTSRYITVSGIQGMVIDPNLTAFGRSAGSNIISTSAPAIRTVLIGASAGQNITTGQANVIVGVAGTLLTTGNYNTIMGDLSGVNLVGGNTNTLIGYEAGQNLTTGSGNLTLGSRSGNFLADGVTRFTGGTENTIVGNSIRLLTANDTNSIIIGSSAFGLGSNTTVIGNSSTTFSSIFGNLGVATTTNAGFRLDVNGTARIQNQLTTTGSITASSLIARGTYLNQTLVASANNDVLVGLDIAPTFTNGAFTGVTNTALRASGNITSSGSFVSTTVFPNQLGFYTTGGISSPAGFYANTYRGVWAGGAAYSFMSNSYLSTQNNSVLLATRPSNPAFSQFQLYVTTGNTTVFDTGGGSPTMDIAANGTTYCRFDGINFSVGSTSALSRMYVRGIGSTSATTAFRVDNSSSSPSLTVLDNGFVGINTTTNSGFKFDVIGTTRLSGDTLINGGLTATTLSATVKMFDINHPTKEGLRLRHGNLEGPENGVYYRGTIINQKEIVLPDYWEGLVDDNTITVYLTPIDFYQTLFVVSKSNKRIIIDNKEENNHFDFIVFGERKDVDKLITEYKK